ncbi:shugoshin-1-like isoform X2 [Miscanthus floridulus]|uniref:shugoshin-1-like isoform X2 n=1 Tax=Miscanthus floridulus TaxID=154761 RepID=UPI00345A39C5
MTDRQSMEVEAPVLAPQQAVSPPAAALSKKTLASDAASTPKRRASRRKTLCDITNLSKRDPADLPVVPDESACPAAPAPASAGGVEKFAQLVKNEELVRHLAERDEIIQLSGAEIQKLRVANSELARTNSQMMAEVNLARNRLKALQHELACSRASLKVKTSDLEDVKKTMQRRNAPVQRTQHLGPDRAAQTKDGDVVDAEPDSDASRARSIQRSGNASRKRVLRSRSLGPTTSAKVALPKDKDRDASQRRKSMRIPQPGNRTEDLFEIEDVQLAISSCKIDPESASGSDKPGHQFLRRSSLGRPLRQAKERVTTYKEMPLHVKLRRP